MASNSALNKVHSRVNIHRWVLAEEGAVEVAGSVVEGEVGVGNQDHGHVLKGQGEGLAHQVVGTGIEDLTWLRAGYGLLVVNKTKTGWLKTLRLTSLKCQVG